MQDDVEPEKMREKATEWSEAKNVLFISLVATRN